MRRSLLTLGMLAALAPAHAEEGARAMPARLPEAYTQECAACHLAYPPGMLPAASWKRLMNNLGQHFGTDASLDAATVTQLAGWLQANAGRARRVSQAPPEDRITRSEWFVREHRQVAATVWNLPSVGSASNCAACHTDAARGRFSEHALQAPAGAGPAQRRAFQHDD